VRLRQNRSPGKLAIAFEAGTSDWQKHTAIIMQQASAQMLIKRHAADKKKLTIFESYFVRIGQIGLADRDWCRLVQ
jgi:hypothetical protein